MLAMAWLTLFASARANSLGAPQAIEPGAFTPVGSPRSAVDFTSQQPHPAVARIVVPEGDATSYGSGTLVDVRDQYGLVVTNWHVVRDGNGEVEVIFPDGFRSKARPLKVDSDWDLAALVVWRPNAAPVKLAATAPQAGEQLTICGYGSGNYRAATGRCTQYYAPAENLPQHMVELDVEARQGDSGGPIFNARGELAGVLFGAGQGTTLGSFGGRVEHFLASLAPNIGSGTQGAAAIAHAEPPQSQLEADNINRGAGAMLVGMHSPNHSADAAAVKRGHSSEAESALSFAATTSHGDWQAVEESPSGATLPAATNATMMHVAADGGATHGSGFSWFESTKNVLALVGIAAIVVQSLRLIR